jgi:hypothetical protein
MSLLRGYLQRLGFVFILNEVEPLNFKPETCRFDSVLWMKICSNCEINPPKSDETSVVHSRLFLIFNDFVLHWTLLCFSSNSVPVFRFFVFHPLLYASVGMEIFPIC